MALSEGEQGELCTKGRLRNSEMRGRGTLEVCIKRLQLLALQTGTRGSRAVNCTHFPRGPGAGSGVRERRWDLGIRFTLSFIHSFTHLAIHSLILGVKT